MSSILRIEASRANGAKSHGPITAEGKLASSANSVHATGPVTPEGKTRVSQNAVRHGLLSRTVVLHNERNSSFDDILSGLHSELQPVGFIESSLVEKMAVADWRLQRTWAVEMASLTHAIHEQERKQDPIADEENDRIPAMHTALAFEALCASGRGIRVLHRYEADCRNSYHRYMRDFKQARLERLSKSEFTKQTEPNLGEIPIEIPDAASFATIEIPSLA